MKKNISSFLLIIALLEIHLLRFTDAVGSKTYEGNNGFPITFLSDLVNSNVVSKKLNSRWKWEVWDVVPGTHAYQIYVFSITNPDEVEKGGKPNLKQLGPYYYGEYRYKFDVSMNLDMSVNFQRNFTYTFDASKSKGSEDDTVNIINAPLLIFSQLASKYNQNEANQAVNSLVSVGESLVKRNVRVGDLIFSGMDVSKYKKYVTLMGPSTVLTQEFQDGRYAVLKLKGGAHEGQFTVDSGFKVERNVGSIISYNGRQNLSYWNGETCNKIQGSDGSVFPPGLSTTDKLYMLEVDLCRSISYEYSKQTQSIQNVMTYVYSISKDTFEDSSVQPDNACFCEKGTSCLKNGVQDVSLCQNGAPYVMSFAHFLNANVEYQQGVAGLKPNPAIHQTEVTIEPITGAVTTFHKRYQWNIWLKPIPGIDYFKKNSSLIVPILWNDDVFSLDRDKEEILVEELAGRAGGMGSSSDSLLKLGNPSVLITHMLLILFAKLVVEY